MQRLRKKLAKDIWWLSRKEHSDRDSGYMISRVQSDAQNIGSLVKSIATLGKQFLLLVASIVLTWILLKSAVFVLIPKIILTFIMGIYSNRAIHSRSIIMMENKAIDFGSVGKLVEGRETLASQGGSRKATTNVIHKQTDHIGSMKRLLFTQTSLSTITGIIGTAGLAVLLGWSGFLVAWREITFGDWYALNLSTWWECYPLRSINGTHFNIR